MDNFSDFVSSSPEFHVGYMVGRSTQQWIFSREDLQCMYESAQDNEILLWCDKKVLEKSSRKRKSATLSSEGETSSKVSKLDDANEEILQIIDQLKEKHSNKYTLPQLRLWAKFIQSRRHESFEEPPNIPLITGNVGINKGSKRESIGEVVAGAAVAIVEALKGSPKKSTTPVPKSFSPNNHANLRRKHLEDLRTLHSLLQDGALSDEEYKEQKMGILTSLRELNPQS